MIIKNKINKKSMSDFGGCVILKKNKYHYYKIYHYLMSKNSE